jgi:hypothetical protein
MPYASASKTRMRIGVSSAAASRRAMPSSSRTFQLLNGERVELGELKWPSAGLRWSRTIVRYRS